MSAAENLQAAQLQIEAGQVRALNNMAAAQQANAATNAARFRVYSQQAGVPQIFMPGVGMVPYAYGIASPLPPLVVPQFQVGAANAAAASAIGGTPLPAVGTPLPPLDASK